MVQTSGERGKLACCNIYSVITHIQFSTVRAHTMERSVKQHFKTQILKRLLLRQLLQEGETRAETI